jgi:hypothetical protein
MALEMKKECEKCHHELPANGMAMICSLMNALSAKNAPAR